MLSLAQLSPSLLNIYGYDAISAQSKLCQLELILAITGFNWYHQYNNIVNLRQSLAIYIAIPKTLDTGVRWYIMLYITIICWLPDGDRLKCIRLCQFMRLNRTLNILADLNGQSWSSCGTHGGMATVFLNCWLENMVTCSLAWLDFYLSDQHLQPAILHTIRCWAALHCCR